MSKLTLSSVAMLACTSLGCAMSAGENRRLAEDLQRAQLRTLEGQVRVAELERRFVELERASRTKMADSPEQLGLAQLVNELDVLIAQNQVFLSQLAQAEAPGRAEPAMPSNPPADDGCKVDAADPREQLRFWGERVRADSTRWRGGLSTAESDALNVLLRPERPLDPSNPWRNR